jgi:hypothetical protein
VRVSAVVGIGDVSVYTAAKSRSLDGSMEFMIQPTVSASVRASHAPGMVSDGRVSMSSTRSHRRVAARPAANEAVCGLIPIDTYHRPQRH